VREAGGMLRVQGHNS